MKLIDFFMNVAIKVKAHKEAAKIKGNKIVVPRGNFSLRFLNTNYANYTDKDF